MMHQDKLQRTFVREEAYLVLCNEIVEGRFEPGRKLRDKELAEQLGVSRTPIREALLRLEEEGLVQTKPNCSTVVCPIDFHSLLNLYSIAWSLENLALKQAFEKITDESVDLMTKANERLLQALKSNDSVAAVQADNDFHSIYIQLSQNEELCRILSGIKQKLKRLELYYFAQVKDGIHSYEEHVQIIEALKKRDMSLALKAVESNWQASLSRIQNQTK